MSKTYVCKSYAFKDSLSGLESPPSNHRRKRYFRDNLRGKIQNEKLPTFDGDVKFR